MADRSSFDPNTDGENPRHTVPAEAAHTGMDRELRRIRLLVRSAATASLSEAEFVRRVRLGGVAMWPSGRHPSGVITRYRVELGIGSGKDCADTDLGGDLVLPVLRGDWATGGHASAQAAVEWRGLRRPYWTDREKLELSDLAVWPRVFSDANAFNRHLAHLARSDHDEWAWAARRLAGLCAAWSLRAENASGRTPFEDACAELARSAELTTAPVRRIRDRPGLGRVAYVLTQLISGGDSPREFLLLLVQVLGAMEMIATAHRTRGELTRYRHIHDATAPLEALCPLFYARAVQQPSPRRRGRRSP